MSSLLRARAVSFCQALNTSNLSTISELLADTFTHELLPRSLGPAARKRNRDETLELWKLARSHVHSHTISRSFFQTVIERENSIMLMVSDAGIKADGSTYALDYILIFAFDVDAKMTTLIEYHDSLTATKMFPEAAETL
ncbi:hypothetical protein DL96DRAFT_1813705 [Flagelloscypha sp. PMI_526]|nr:hypothetical protein DL96DRAFT_1813705 [Flagelloscypha sp. PMI_526]